MKTVLKSLFIFAFAAMVSSCDFFGANHDKPLDEKPTTVIPEDSAAGDATKVEEKKEEDSAAVPTDSSKEAETTKEAK